MANEARFTPAPWKWVGQNLEGPNYADVIDAKVSCGAWCLGGSADLAISDADRALIAAAPALLDALQSAVALADANCTVKNGQRERTPACQASYDKCVAAIALAMGAAS